MSKNTTGPIFEEKLCMDDQRPLDLSDNDRKVFVEALINPQPVNDRLRETVRRYREAAGV